MTLRTSAPTTSTNPTVSQRSGSSCVSFTRTSTQAVAGLAPLCELSGRCCRFREYGHTLFLSAAEAAPADRRCASARRRARRRRSCPWQDRPAAARPGGPPPGLPRLLLRPVVSRPPSRRALARRSSETDSRGWPTSIGPGPGTMLRSHRPPRPLRHEPPARDGSRGPIALADTRDDAPRLTNRRRALVFS